MLTWVFVALKNCREPWNARGLRCESCDDMNGGEATNNPTTGNIRQHRNLFSYGPIQISTMSTTVLSETHFLQRDPLYDVEKPYSLRFTPPSTFPRANIKLEKHTIQITDIRTRTKPLTFLNHGFALLPFTSSMHYADFDDDEIVKRVYLREAANLLRDHLGAEKVQVFEHTVRKRHETFPISTGEAYRWNQPTSIAHVDTTIGWAIDMAKQLNPGDESIGKGRIQCVKYVVSFYSLGNL